MCPLKREQATRVSYNTLTDSSSIIEIGRKSRSWIKSVTQTDDVQFTCTRRWL